MKVDIDDSEVQGRGDGLHIYAVTFVDTEDAEDTQIELWSANDKDDLYDQVCATEDKELEESPFNRLIEEEWGMSILFQKVGDRLSNS